MTSLFAPLLLTLLSTVSPTQYVAALGDSIVRGDVLPTCPGPASPCPTNFFDDAARALGFVGLQYDFGLDGRNAGGPNGGGVIANELPRYCAAPVAFAYTVIHTGGNDVELMRKHSIWGATSLSGAASYYRTMVREAEACHPETTFVMVSISDYAYRCARVDENGKRTIDRDDQTALAAFNAYIRQIAAGTPGAKYLDTWGAHALDPVTGNDEPYRVTGKPWFYGPDWHGYVDGTNTGGDCKHPGTIGHRHLARALIEVLKPAVPGHAAPR